MNMNGQSWDNKTQAVDFTNCGTKKYNVKDRNEIPNCVRECVVRTFLEKKNMSQYIAKLEKVEPTCFFDYLKTLKVEDIQNKFFDVCTEVAQHIWNNRNTFEEIKLYIEKGDAERVISAVSNNAFNTDESQAENMIHDIFTVINQIHSVGVIHADIKPENFLYCKRGNKEILVLNDFNTSFVLPCNTNSILLNATNQIVGITPRYAAPEQFGVPECKIGHATDVFSASLIAYTMLNGGRHPKEYDVLNETPKEYQYSQMKKMFQEMNNNEQDFDPCERGTELKEIISKGIKINPAERPSAIKFLSIVNHQNTGPEIPTEVAEPSSPKNKETEAPTEKKEEQTVKEPEEKTDINSHNTDDHSDNHANNGIVLVIIALIAAGVIIVALVVISKSGGGTNISNNVSVTASIATSTFEIETSEIPTEYITTVSSTTETTSEIIQSTETEKKKKILLQL